MNIIPSLDLQDGRCVRLKKGCFDQVTTYVIDPIQVIKAYEASGARIVHIVDLSGAKNEACEQVPIILKLRKATHLSIQFGGGVRTRENVDQLLSGGINKIVLGSLAVTNPEFTQKLLFEFGSQNFILAFDVKLDPDKVPIVAMNGWQAKSNITLWKAIDNYHNYNLSEILCTDIDKDGMLSGPNFELYAECLSRYPSIRLQASGGICHTQDLQTLSSMGLNAAIIGKAIFENKIRLKDALAGGFSC